MHEPVTALSNYKDLFVLPQTLGGPYLLSHSVGAMTRKGQAYLDTLYLEPWQAKGGAAWDDWLELIDRFSKSLAGLLHGSAADFCPQPNLSAGLTKYLTALPSPGQRSQILMHAHAFPSMGFVAQALGSRGYTLSLIPADRPEHQAEVWEDYLTDKTACAMITHAHSNTGRLSPVKDIIGLCRKRGVSPLVDIAQSVGVIPINVRDWDADLVLGSCVKWLCGGPGAGFMWVHPDRLSDLQPEDVGWFSHSNPFEFDITHFDYHPTARRFWGGTPSVAPYATALGGIETISDIGVGTIRAHNLRLMQSLEPDLNPAHQSGTLCLPITAAQNDSLTLEQFQYDRRGDIARLSFHIYNTPAQAERLAEIIR